MITTLVYRDNRFAALNPPPETLAALRADESVMLWIDLAQPTPDEISAILEALFALHPLVVEDCLSETRFPKYEVYDDYLYLVMHAVDYSRSGKFTTTELDLLLGKRFLVTFHRQPLKPLQAALDRYRKNPTTAVRGPDRFAHVILDLMTDAYQPAIEELRAEIAGIEHAAIHESGNLLPRLLAARRDLAALRQIVRPQHQIVADLAHGRSGFFRPIMLPYLRDLAEDLARIERSANAWSEQLILAFRVFLNRADHEANLGIRVLTALTALTLPVLVIGGWFGMNFRHMPEVPGRFSYPLAFALTIISTLGMLIYLRKRRWF
ncbi:MAG: magnesium transporter CorA family protein [Opitutaceae bacterium]|nr:magnesium transporter CorA family protein [Opitutaceae bacterium]